MEKRIFVGKTQDDKIGTELFLYKGIWLSELDIKYIQMEEEQK